MRTIVLSILVGTALIVAALLLLRYELVAAPNTDRSKAYRIDRITGEVFICQLVPREGGADFSCWNRVNNDVALPFEIR